MMFIYEYSNGYNVFRLYQVNGSFGIIIVYVFFDMVLLYFGYGIVMYNSVGVMVYYGEMMFFDVKFIIILDF